MPIISNAPTSTFWQLVVLLIAPLVLIVAAYLVIHIYETSISPQAYLPQIFSEALSAREGRFALEQSVGSQVAGALAAVETAIAAEPVIDAPKEDVPEQVVVPQSPTPPPTPPSTQSPTPPSTQTPAVLPPPPIIDTPTDSSEMTKAEKSELLKLHNQIRKAVGVPALSWSVSLEASAAAWSEAQKANGCKIEHSGNGLGETIYYSSRTGVDLTPRTPQEVIDAFMVEKAYYNHDTHTCRAGEICGHYTQIIWGDTTHVGCAKSVCRDEGREEVWTCHYTPTGNVEGMPPF